MKVALLTDHPEVLPTLADWYQQEWKPYYGVEGPGDAHADLRSRCNTDEIPIGLVALMDNQIQGVVALDLDVATGLAPSVVGLLVAAEFRGRGVATRLLESITGLAKKLGYDSVYISTNVLGDYLLRTGWRLFGETRFLDDDAGSIYVLELSGLER